MTIILYIIAAYIVVTAVYLLAIFKSRRQRFGNQYVENIRDSAYTAAPDTKHQPRRLSSWRTR